MQEKHPKGLYMLFGVEMWERFSFYGMRALLVLYMTKQLLFTTEQAGKLYGWYQGLVYLTPLIGGYISDKYLGTRKAIIIGGLLMAMGQFVLSVQTLPFFYTALTLIILGNGFFKPNISTIVGGLYGDNDPRRDGGFTIFYMGINLGALMAPFICGYLGEKVGWSYGFSAAGVGMLCGLALFIWGKDRYLGTIGILPAGREVKTADNKVVEKAPLTTEEKQRIAVIFIMAFFTIFFWACFEQAGSSLTLFADRNVNRRIFGWEMPASFFQAVNPLFIMIFAPLFSKLWIGLSKKNMEPSTPFKFAWGLLALGCGYILLLAGVHALQFGPVSMFWLIGAYFFHTMGELCLSPVGLSMVTKLAPAQFASLLMGTWFAASALGDFTAGLYASNFDKMSPTQFFLYPTLFAFGAAIVVYLMVEPIKRWMHGK